MNRLNPLFKFSILNLAVVLILIISLSIVGSYLFKEILLYREGKVVADFVRVAATDTLFSHDLSSQSEETFKAFVEQNLLALPDLKEVRIYDRDGYILWSTRKELIGQRSEGIAKLIKDQPVATLKPVDSFSPPEPSFEIYVPLLSENPSALAGIIGVAKDPSDLLKIIRDGRILIWIISFVGGLFLYTSLFSVFYKAYRMEKKMTEGIVRLNKELSVFNRIATGVSRSIDLESLLKDALDSTLEALNMSGGWILLIDEKDGTLRLAAHKGIPEEMIKTFDETRIAEGVTGKVARTGEVVVKAKLSDHPGLKKIEGYDIESCASIPLKAMDKVLGVMEIMCPACACELPLESPKLFSAIGHQIGAAISKSILYKEVVTLKEHLEEMVEEKTKQVIQMEKLSTLGELMGAIAHQLNNPLVGVVNFSQYVLNRLEKDHPLREEIETILKAGTECKEIIQKLLAFSRQSNFERCRADINSLLDECLSLVERQFDLKGIKLERNYSSLTETMVDITLMRQAFLNIIINALQAMTKGGRLSISTKVVNTHSQEKQIEIDITDTGKGIKEMDLPKIFNPFFTTKDEGLGLGLTVVRDIIYRHRGEIEVTSKEGMGTTFIIRLPATL